jgi:hypothetical protein
VPPDFSIDANLRQGKSVLAKLPVGR